MDAVGDRSQLEGAHQRCYKTEAGELVQLKWSEHQKQHPTFRVQASGSIGPTSTSTSTMTMDVSGDLKSVQHYQQAPAIQTVPEKPPAAAKWTLADDQSMLDVLLYAREVGDVAPNGHFKMQTWQDVTFAVAASTTGGGRKDVENCKSRLQRVE